MPSYWNGGYLARRHLRLYATLTAWGPIVETASFYPAFPDRSCIGGGQFLLRFIVIGHVTVLSGGFAHERSASAAVCEAG